MSIVLSLEDIPCDALKHLYRRWDALEKTPYVPAKTLMSDQVPGSVSAYCKLAVIEPPVRVKYVSVGYALKEMYPEPIEGHYLEDLFAPWIRQKVQQTYEVCLSETKAVYERKGFSTIVGSIGYEYLLLPFYDRDKYKVEAILSCVLPLKKDIKKYLDWKEPLSLTPWLQ